LVFTTAIPLDRRQLFVFSNHADLHAEGAALQDDQQSHDRCQQDVNDQQELQRLETRLEYPPYATESFHAVRADQLPVLDLLDRELRESDSDQLGGCERRHGEVHATQPYGGACNE